MTQKLQTTLSRRERQIMDIAHRRGRVTVREIVDELPDPPSYSAVRALVGVLEEKGHLRHLVDGPELTREELDELGERIDQARKEGR